MTSDAAEKNDSRSPERKKLDLVMSDHQVDLSKFTAKELSEFLWSWLSKVYLRELRDFKPLRDTISFRGDQQINVSIAAQVVLGKDFSGPFNFNTHTIWAYRGVISVKHTYRRHESDDETTDREVARSWGNQAYIYHGEETTLLLRRQPNHSRADENLIRVTYFYKKVPHKQEWVTYKVLAEQVHMQTFKKMFGKKSPEIAQTLIWEIRSILSRTHHALVSQAKQIEGQIVEWERIGNVISSGRYT